MRHRTGLLPVAVLLAVLSVAFAAGCNQKEDDRTLPADLTALLPPAPTAIVVVSGIAAVDAALVDLDARAADEPLLPPEAREKLDLGAALERAVPGLSAAVDPTRPLALAFVAPPPMTQDAGLTLVVPLRDPEAALPAPAAPFQASVVHGRYLALSTDAAHAAADSVPALARGLRPGLVSGAVDLAGVIAQYRGLMEMSIGMMAMGAAAGGEDGAEAMTPEEAQALAVVLRGLMDSARRLDLAADLDGGMLRLAGRLGVVPGAPLSPAADQPDFGRAAALAGLLPADADVLEAWAADQTRELAFMRPYYLAGMRKELADLPPEQAAAYETWFTGYLDMVPRLACPAAAALDFGEDGVGLLAVLEAADPAGLASALAGQMDALTAAGVGLAFVPLEPAEAAGVAVQRWRVVFDDEALAAGLGRDVAGSPGAQQAAQTLLALGDLLPEVSLATVGGFTLLGATSGDESFAALAERARRGPGRPEPRVAAAAAEAGPACRQVVVGDLMPLANWLSGLVEELSGEAGLPRLDTAVPFSTFAAMDAGGYAFGTTTDIPAVRAAVAAVRAMAAGPRAPGTD